MIEFIFVAVVWIGITALFFLFVGMGYVIICIAADFIDRIFKGIDDEMVD